MFIIFALWKLSSACSLCIIKFGLLKADFPIFSTCFAVFQNNLEFVVSVESKPSSLSKYLFYFFFYFFFFFFFDFRILVTILFRSILYLSRNNKFEVLLNFIKLLLRFLGRFFV